MTSDMTSLEAAMSPELKVHFQLQRPLLRFIKPQADLAAPRVTA
jgi:hypothetical protein